jgi:hypothetical protein
LSGVASATTSGIKMSRAASEPLVLPSEREDDGMQHLRALFQFRVLPPETGNFLIGVATRTQAGLWAGGRWLHALFDLPTEVVTQVDGTVSGCLADARDRGDVLPGELGVGWHDAAVEKAAHGHFELAPIVQRHSHD